MKTIDVFKTIQKVSKEVVFKDRGSKFIGYAFPITKEEDVQPLISELKANHHKARHWCYAWRIGVEEVKYRVNDDGEPNNSAGKPIYGQILSLNLTNVLLVVVRYFGGVKLGVGGLINAYKTTAKLTLENSIIVEKLVKKNFNLEFEYRDMDKLMRLIKENKIEIISQDMDINCKIQIAIRMNQAEKIKRKIKELRFVKID